MIWGDFWVWDMSSIQVLPLNWGLRAQGELDRLLEGFSGPEYIPPIIPSVEVDLCAPAAPGASMSRWNPRGP